MTVFGESFVFGLVNSLHCAGMCGPLAACFMGGAAPVAAYHAGRTAAYLVVGALAGAIGAGLGADRLDVPSAWIAFVLAGALVLFMLGGERLLGAIPGVGAALQKVFRFTAKMNKAPRAAAIGTLTPLLPCGLLYAVYAAALLSGSWMAGAETMLGFALGSLPVLVLVQTLLARTQVGKFRRWLGPRGLAWIQRVAFLSAAGVLVWRGIVDLQGAACH